MYQPPFQSFSGDRGRGGRGRGDRGGRGRGRGRGRGGFHNNNNHHRNNNRQLTEVDYSPEAIESRFAAFYLPSMTQDPWQHLSEQK